jgi:hypothetical protein
MKPALLLITFLTPGGSETRWTEQTGTTAVCHGRALELAEWAASRGVRVRYSCQNELTVSAQAD